MLLVAGERLTFLPAFLFEVSHDMQPGGFGGLIPPELAHGFNARKMVSQLAVAHSVRWLAGEFIQPAVDFRERLAQLGKRFGAMLFKGGHRSLGFQEVPLAVRPSLVSAGWVT